MIKRNIKITEQEVVLNMSDHIRIYRIVLEIILGTLCALFGFIVLVRLTFQEIPMVFFLPGASFLFDGFYRLYRYRVIRRLYLAGKLPLSKKYQDEIDNAEPITSTKNRLALIGMVITLVFLSWVLLFVATQCS